VYKKLDVGLAYGDILEFVHMAEAGMGKQGEYGKAYFHFIIISNAE
jgi:hypothetical protein